MLRNLIRNSVRVAAIASVGAATAAAGRYFSSRRVNAAQRLGEALLEDDHLREAQRYSDTESEAALASCAAYLINAAHYASEGIVGPPANDPIGYERRVQHKGGGAFSSIITTAHEPEMRWQFQTEIPGIGQISGSRRLTNIGISKLSTQMKTPDTMSIRLPNGYSATLESDLKLSGPLLTVPWKKSTPHGVISLSDNKGNVGRLEILNGGQIQGTITRGSEIVGRFDGSLVNGLQFHQYPATSNHR